MCLSKPWLSAKILRLVGSYGSFWASDSGLVVVAQPPRTAHDIKTANNDTGRNMPPPSTLSMSGKRSGSRFDANVNIGTVLPRDKARRLKFLRTSYTPGPPNTHLCRH